MGTATIATGALERYARAARDAGCPRDQFENFARAGVVLQPKQLMASAAARMCDATGGPGEVGFGGARGPGKSFWGLSQVALDDCQRFPGLKWLFLRKVGKAAKESFEDIRQKVLVHVGHRYNRQEGVVYFANGSRIVIGHFQKESDIDAYLGIEYDGILTEEATTLTAAKDRAISTCCRSSKAGWRPRRYSTTNPGGVGHVWYKQKFVQPWRRGQESETRFIPGTVRDNCFINPEYRGTLEKLVGWQKAAWLDGDWDIAAGQFFINWRHDLHVITPRELPKTATWWASLDYGFVHYTAIYPMCYWDGAIYVTGEHCERGWLPQQHVAGFKALLARQGLALHNLRTVVAGADVFSKDQYGHTIAEKYEEQGMKLKCADVDRVNGAAEVLQRLGNAEADPPILPTLFVFNTCSRLIECIPALQHDPHRPEDVLKWDADPESGEGGDDPYDAVRYGVMAQKRPPADWKVW